MESLPEILEKNSSDPRVRLELGQKLLDYFSHHSLPSNSTVLNDFVDAMVQWLTGSNFKVALLSLEILEVGLGQSGDLLAPYLLEHVGALMERLGDRQESVRNAAQDLLLKFMHLHHAPPQVVMERMLGGLTHKQWLVRVGVMLTLQETLKTFGAASLQLSKLTPLVAKLSADPTVAVRDTASDTLLAMYLHVGDKLAQDLHRKRLLPDNKAGAIFGRFEDAKRQGLIGSNGEPLAERTVPDRAAPVFKSPAPARPLPTASSSTGTGPE